MTTATITHRNLLSQRAYTGKYNLKLLDSAGYTKPLWLTFHQIKKCGRKLKQGTKGLKIIYIDKIEKVKADGSIEEEAHKLYHIVFNVEQCITPPKK